VTSARLPVIGRAFRRTALRQSLAVAAVAILAGILAGVAGLLSALLGGAIGIVGLVVFALVSAGARTTAQSAMRLALRAEAAKIVVVVALLWVNFTLYRDMVVPAFMGAFMVSVLLAGFAFAVSDQ